MLTQNDIHNIVDSFFLCTHIPIQAFKVNGTLIYRAGFNDKLVKIFNNNKVCCKVKTQLQKNSSKFPINIYYKNNIYFTVYYLNSRKKVEIVFLLGPCLSKKNSKIDIIYKPIYIMEYSVLLLEKIINNNIYNINNQNTYNFHVKKAIDYIYQNYAETINLKSISSYLEINSSYFSYIFKKETGKTFVEMLNEVRIEKSKELLLETNLSVLEIALAVGFNNQSYYNIVFKKLNNLTPLEYRNSQKQQVLL